MHLRLIVAGTLSLALAAPSLSQESAPAAPAPTPSPAPEQAAPAPAPAAGAPAPEAPPAAAPKVDAEAEPKLTHDVYPPIRTFLDLEAYASELASKPYQPPISDLTDYFKNLDYDGHRHIRFKREKALFEEQPEGFRVEFSHQGWMFQKPVGIHEIVDGQPVEILLNKDMFSYGDLKLPEDVIYPSGFSGWRLLTDKKNVTGARMEYLTFQGASYFRAVADTLGWGLSARGVAVNTIGGQPEEFPDFTHFWLVRPREGEKTFKFYALLNGPSITGAYQFEVEPGASTVMKVKGSLYLRKLVNMLGIAPFSSMFWFGENTRPVPLDFRPEVHDSDGLLIERKNGMAIWRPMDNGREMRHSVYALEDMKGFGVLQRDRNFENYQDLEAKYHNRVSVWVEPQEGFGRGKLHLIELATGEETWDNVVTMWEPEMLPTATEPLRFSYNLHWLKEHEHSLAKVISTRWGEGVATMRVPDDYEFVIDYTKGQPAGEKAADWVPDVKVEISGEAKLLDKRVMLNPETGGWRAFFKLDISPATNLLEMTCDLLDDGKPLSERWSYQWRR